MGSPLAPLSGVYTSLPCSPFRTAEIRICSLERASGMHLMSLLYDGHVNIYCAQQAVTSLPTLGCSHSAHGAVFDGLYVPTTRTVLTTGAVVCEPSLPRRFCVSDCRNSQWGAG